jgi:hypothetical protein
LRLQSARPHPGPIGSRFLQYLRGAVCCAQQDPQKFEAPACTRLGLRFKVSSLQYRNRRVSRESAFKVFAPSSFQCRGRLFILKTGFTQNAHARHLPAPVWTEPSTTEYSREISAENGEIARPGPDADAGATSRAWNEKFAHSEWIQSEIEAANDLDKPSIAVEPRGNERFPDAVMHAASAKRGWNSTSIITAIRRQMSRPHYYDCNLRHVVRSRPTPLAFGLGRFL